MSFHSKNLPADERRTVTIKSVVELAGTQNPSKITTAAIAKHMNLTQGALFRHFPNKEAIWQAVMELLSNLVYGIQAAFSVDCSSSCLPSLKMTLLTTKVNKLNP